jgi:hypothetical protein
MPSVALSSNAKIQKTTNFAAMIKEMRYWKWQLLLLAGFFLALLMYGVAGMVDMMPRGWWYAAASLAVSALMILLYARFVVLFEGEKPLDLPLDRLHKDTGRGLAVGLVYFCLVTGIMALADGYKIMSVGAPVREIIWAFCYFALVAVGEEILFRGVLFRWIDEKWGFPWALGISALIFGLVHWANPGGTLWAGIAIAIEAGVLLGAAYKWSGTLWFPIGIHWAWNFSQGNLFGFKVSGQDAGVSLVQAQTEGPDWLTGGVFGAEASVIAVVVGAAVSAWFIYRISKR